MTQLTQLIERLEKAEAGSIHLDVEIERAAWPDRLIRDGMPLGRYSRSLDAAIALVERVLPGWSWKVGTCCVSDDAWLCPDWNSEEHGDRLREEIGEAGFGSWSDVGIDVDLRPPGKPSIALCIALLRALEAKEAGQ